MPELLLFAQNPAGIIPPLAPADLAGQPQLFDMIDWHPDGWPWSGLEQTNPCFRIVAWENATEADCAPLLYGLRPTRDPTTRVITAYAQWRASYLNLLDPRIAAAIPDALTWWNDVTRAMPIYTVPSTFSLTIADVMTARTPLAVSS